MPRSCGNHKRGRVGPASRSAARGNAGLGVVSTGLWGCRAELVNGTLVRLLKDWKMEAVEAYAVFPAGRAAKLSARRFADYLAEAFKE